eukprot:CAMPEP_0172500766 /NCGR_PEP_ID=MMETSP1066-20121228/142729_1 /TAXON_ID=671091 /ORGANISM="Coscinodiscus wailesii, Strain CCMP2513" /LENGTH=193 /DNA_ID=CAMNT_0013275189 /DNA_START=205 /DNA_END=783 /DNA_ORIENTATION=-
MGQHLVSLDEMAHRIEHEKKQKKKKNKKNAAAAIAATETQRTDDDGTTLATDPDTHDYDQLDVDDDDESMFFTENDDDNPLPDPGDVKNRMLIIHDKLTSSYRRIRGAEPTPDLFDAIHVKAYGTFNPMNAVAQVVIESASRAVITCYDPDVAPEVYNAVRDAGMNFSPETAQEGSVVVHIPRVSAETRRMLV